MHSHTRGAPTSPAVRVVLLFGCGKVPALVSPPASVRKKISQGSWHRWHRGGYRLRLPRRRSGSPGARTCPCAGWEPRRSLSSRPPRPGGVAGPECKTAFSDRLPKASPKGAPALPFVFNFQLKSFQQHVQFSHPAMFLQLERKKPITSNNNYGHFHLGVHLSTLWCLLENTAPSWHQPCAFSYLMPLIFLVAFPFKPCFQCYTHAHTCYCKHA